MKLFYDHLTNLHSVRPQLVLLLRDESEIEEVLDELDKAMHYVVMHVIFQELPSHVHEPFLERFKENPADREHLIYLRRYASEIEEKIRMASEESKQKFLDAIHR